jgi:hypothetical protein
MLPQDGDKDENRGDEDDGESDLGNGSRREGLNFALGAFRVLGLVPAGEGGEEDEADKGENNGNDSVLRSVMSCIYEFGWDVTHIRYGNTIISLNCAASQIKLSGSWSTETSLARAVALLLQSHEPPSGLTQIPK